MLDPNSIKYIYLKKYIYNNYCVIDILEMTIVK